MKMKYRAEIDGLRAIAVVPVILFHAGFETFSGGFIGVDVFFVISGYLITSILISDIESDKFSILTFYERRARRILPALFLVIFCCIPFAWRWMYPLALNDFFQSVVATMLFASNFLFWSESGYFQAATELKPLLHTWSLAIEEQFYLFFPFVLYLIWGKHSQRGIIALSVLLIASLVFSVFGAMYWPEFNFYLLPSRIWELMAGAICAALTYKNAPKPNYLGGYVGVLLLLFGFIFLDGTVPWPSMFTIIPVLGTTIIIMWCTSENGAGRLLSFRPIVVVGLLSYSAYLWHQPLFAFARLRLTGDIENWTKAILIATTFMLAFLTWKYVEQPFRKKENGNFMIGRTTIFACSFAVACAFFAIGIAGHLTDGFPSRKAPSGVAFQELVKALSKPRHLPCDFDLTFKSIPDMPPQQCVFTTNGKPAARALIIGDSHATMIAKHVRDELLAKNIETTVITFRGCIPFPGVRFAGRNCDDANQAVYKYLKNESFDLVIISFRPQYLYAGPIPPDKNKILAQKEPIFVTHTEGVGAGANKKLHQTLAIIDQGLHELLATKSKLIVFYPVPEARSNIGQITLKKFAFELKSNMPEFTTPFKLFTSRAGPVVELLDGIKSPNIFAVRPHELLCTPSENKCANILDGTALYGDDNHLSLAGVKLIMPLFRDTLEKVLALEKTINGPR